MNFLQFYFPGAVTFLDSSRTNPMLVECGLDRVFDGTRPQMLKTYKGPDGGVGIFAPLRREEFDKDDILPSVLTPKDDSHVWESCMGGKYWVGYHKAHKPGPGDLVRANTMKGYNIVLDDGTKWHVPVMRFLDGDTALPQIMKLNPDGTVFRKETPRYAHVVALVQDFWERFMSTDPNVTVPWELAFDIAGYSIEINYHANKWVMSALELINESNIKKIAEAACDWPAVERVIEERKEAKKKASDAPTQDGSST